MAQKPKVLVIDDNENVLFTMQFSLQSEYDVTTVNNGESGIEKATITDFDVAIVDILMPNGISGIETLEGLKQVSQATEVILLSGYSSPITVKSAEKYGAFAHMEKGDGIEKLKLLISKAVQSRKSRLTQYVASY